MVSTGSGQLAGNRGQKGPAPQVFLDQGRAAPRRTISCPFMPARKPNPTYFLLLRRHTPRGAACGGGTCLNLYSV